MGTAHAPIHPGEILLEEFLAPLAISQYRLAQAIGVPPRRINEIVHGKRSISPDTALRLSPGTRHVGSVLDELADSLRLGRPARGPSGRTRQDYAPGRLNAPTAAV
jgi:addiction module HigA family antidote